DTTVHGGGNDIDHKDYKTFDIIKAFLEAISIVHSFKIPIFIMPITHRTTPFRTIIDTYTFYTTAKTIINTLQTNIAVLNLNYNPIINLEELNIQLEDNAHPTELSYLGIAHKVSIHTQKEL
ncbi:unnamed protein product, partial [Meganyctiphanes norvegica]